MQFRLLTPNNIELRVGRTSDKTTSFLLYKDARCDMAILDATVGAEKWQRHHYELKGNIYCEVGIYCEQKNGFSEWVWKGDCGSEGNYEKAKSEASDSFKRACVCWGIGRELYTAPKIFIPNEKLSFDASGKYLQSDLKVQKIAYDANRAIIGLIITDYKTGKPVYTYMVREPKENNGDRVFERV